MSHLSGLIVAEFARTGEYATNVDRLRAVYRGRRDALLTAIGAALGDRAQWIRPAGGCFVWVSLPPGIDPGALLPRAEAAGTSFMTGSTFDVGPPRRGGHGSLRLAFARYPPDRLTESVLRLASAIETG